MKKRIVAMLLALSVVSVLMCGCTDEEMAAAQSGDQEIALTGSQAVLQQMDEELKNKTPDAQESEDTMSSFMDQRTGKAEYSSFEEIKGLLEKGEGYAELSLTGMEESLAITPVGQASETGEGVLECAVYGSVNGSIKCLGNIYAHGSKYPIREDLGYIYIGESDEVTQYACDKDTGELIVMTDYSAEVDSMNTRYCIGFVRKENSLRDVGESIDTTDMQAYDSLVIDFNNAKVIKFETKK